MTRRFDRLDQATIVFALLLSGGLLAAKGFDGSDWLGLTGWVASVLWIGSALSFVSVAGKFIAREVLA